MMTYTLAIKLLETGLWLMATVLLARSVWLVLLGRWANADWPTGIMAVASVKNAWWCVRAIAIGSVNPPRGFALNSWLSAEGGSYLVAAMACAWGWWWHFGGGRDRAQ